MDLERRGGRRGEGRDDRQTRRRYVARAEGGGGAPQIRDVGRAETDTARVEPVQQPRKSLGLRPVVSALATTMLARSESGAVTLTPPTSTSTRRLPAAPPGTVLAAALVSGGFPP